MIDSGTAGDMDAPAQSVRLAALSVLLRFCIMCVCFAHGMRFTDFCVYAPFILQEWETKCIKDWTTNDVGEWLIARGWSDLSDVLRSPNGEDLAACSLDDFTICVKDDVIARRLFKSVGLVLDRQRDNKLLSVDEFGRLMRARGGCWL